MPQNEVVDGLGLDEYKYGFVDEEQHVFRTKPGLSEDVVREISKQKGEPEWMLEFRLKALEIYEEMALVASGASHLIAAAQLIIPSPKRSYHRRARRYLEEARQAEDKREQKQLDELAQRTRRQDD